MLFSAEFVVLDNNIVNSHYAVRPPEDQSTAEFALTALILRNKNTKGKMQLMPLLYIFIWCKNTKIWFITYTRMTKMRQWNCCFCTK